MSDKTAIEWTEATWNPVRGCRRISEGCRNCYAERQAIRFAGKGQAYEGLVESTDKGPRWTGKTSYSASNLMDPFRWRKPRRIFTDSMSDLFYDGVETEVIDRVVAVMMICCLHDTRGGHVFQTLTKRPDRMRAYFEDPRTKERVAFRAGQLMEDGDHWYDAIAFRPEGLLHDNLWWGTSIENQDAVATRMNDLLATPARVRFVSVEPLLEAVEIGMMGTLPKDITGGAYVGTSSRLHWVIAGCESGPGARRCDVEWLRALRDEVTPFAPFTGFFLKQAPLTDGIKVGDGSVLKGRTMGGKQVVGLPYLDGKQWAQFPEPGYSHG